MLDIGRKLSVCLCFHSDSNYDCCVNCQLANTSVVCSSAPALTDNCHGDTFCTYPKLLTRIHTYAHTNKHVYMPMHTQTNTYTYLCTQTSTYTYLCAHIQTRIHTYAHAYKHTYIPMHTHTNTYTYLYAHIMQSVRYIVHISCNHLLYP